MIIKNVFHGKNFRWLAGAALAGLLGLAGCAVVPGGGVAYVGPPVVVEAPPVYVAPAPVVVEPAVVMPLPIFIGGGGYRR